MICQKCNHNHNDNQRPWCDRSDLEIKYQTLCEAAEKLAEILNQIKWGQHCSACSCACHDTASIRNASLGWLVQS